MYLTSIISVSVIFILHMFASESDSRINRTHEEELEEVLAWFEEEVTLSVLTVPLCAAVDAGYV